MSKVCVQARRCVLNAWTLLLMRVVLVTTMAQSLLFRRLKLHQDKMDRGGKDKDEGVGVQHESESQVSQVSLRARC